MDDGIELLCAVRKSYTWISNGTTEIVVASGLTYGFETVPLWRSGLSVASIIGERRACTSGTRERRRLERTEMKALKGTDNRVLEVGRHG